MSITSTFFGRAKDGHDVTKYTLTNAIGAYVSILDYGAIINEIVVPDADGDMADVCLGFPDMTGYNVKHGHMGEVIGRFANRIRDAWFEADGVRYDLPKTKGDTHAHGGMRCYGDRMWEAKTAEGKGRDTLTLTIFSPDGEEGYPGNLTLTTTYTWNDNCDLIIRYHATTDKTTVLNITNHAYFNLAGHDHGTVEDHVVCIDSDVITENDGLQIPTGDYLPVAGTAFDMREGLLLEDGFAELENDEQLRIGHGYDQNFVLRKGTAMGLAATVEEEASGRVLEVITDQPGVQFYTANTTNLTGGKNGAVYGPRCGFCLETQHFPDAPHHPQWDSTLLRPGEVFDSTTIYAFRVNDFEL